MHITVDRAIKEAWLYNIKADYSSNFILLEDSLKNAFYYHLRNKLTDSFLIEHNLRIFTELHTGYGERVDIAVVRLGECENVHLREQITDIVAVIELKYKNGTVPVNPFREDINKVKTYSKRKKYTQCQYYLGFIHETEYDLEETPWLSPKEQATWAKGKLTELSAFYNEEKMVFTNISYNGMNEDLNNLRV